MLARNVVGLRLSSLRALPDVLRGVKTQASGLKKGQYIEVDGSLLVVQSADHVKKGRGSAFMQLALTTLNGKKKNMRFRSADKVELADVESSPVYFRREDGDALVFATQDFDELTVPKHVVGDVWVYLADLGEEERCIATIFDEQVLALRLPLSCECVVAETEESIRGDSVNSTYKPAILQNGRTVAVPPFVSTGDVIVVKLPDEQYGGRT